MAEILQKKAKKKQWQRIQGAIQSALEEHGTTLSVGDLGAMVAHTLGLSLDGEYRVRFDKALSRITSPPPERCRKRCRFTITSKRARHQKKHHTMSPYREKDQRLSLGIGQHTERGQCSR